jgi:hypothetical protein
MDKYMDDCAMDDYAMDDYAMDDDAMDDYALVYLDDWLSKRSQETPKGTQNVAY